MKISIVQYEIEAAIKAHILSQIAVNEDQEVTIKLSATRGPEGMTADIIISKAGETNAVTEQTDRPTLTASDTSTKPAPLVPAKPLTFKRPTPGLVAATPPKEAVAEIQAAVATGEGAAATEEQLVEVEQAEDAAVEQAVEEQGEATATDEPQAELVEEAPPAPPAGTAKRSLFKK